VKIPIDSITILPSRQRKYIDPNDITKLAHSIRTIGLIHPIVVEDTDDGRYELIAGECRLRAHRELNLLDIEASLRNNLTPFEKKAIEYEENVRRINLSIEEEALALESFHTAHIEEYGDGYQSGDDRSKPPSGWTIEKTAALLGTSRASVSYDLKVAKAISKDASLVKKFTNKTAIYKAITSREQRAVDEVFATLAMEEIHTSGNDIVEIRLGDSTTELTKIADDSVDLIITDPAYGVAFDTQYRQERSWSGEVFNDDPVKVFNDFRTIVHEMYRILKPGHHIYCFFSISNYRRFRDILEGAKFNLRPIPLIWTKEGRANVPLARTEYGFANYYEPIFYATKGASRPLVDCITRANVFNDCPPPTDRIHSTEKPIKLIEYLIGFSSFEGELIVDPYGGSGVVARAAHKMNRRAIVIEEERVMWMKAKEKFEKYLKEEQ